MWHLWLNVGFVDVGQGEIILRAATRLFAALGYDGTTTRQIAEAAGVSVATVNHHVGGKRELYLAVMERAHRAERIAVEAAVAEFQHVSAAEVLHKLLNRYLDFCVENPEVPALWMHRWLSDAADITELERQYTFPLMNLVVGASAGLEGRGVDVEYTIQSMIWCIQGFAKGGIPDAEDGRRTIEDPRALRRFRAHMHLMVHRMLGMPGRPPRQLADSR